MARFGQTSIGSPEHSVRSAGGCTTPPHAAPRVPFLQRRITNPHSVLAAGGEMAQAIALELAKSVSAGAVIS